jgi:hypothetical protein
MLNVNEIKEIAQNISAHYPVYLVAQYQNGYDKIKIPQCLNCNGYIQVKDYSNIMCECGEKNNFKWHSYKLNNGIITEYNENIIKEDFNFHRVLPIDRLKRLYFYIKPKQQLLGINIDNGEFIVDGAEVGNGIILNKKPIVSSNQLQKYDNLFVFKDCLASPGKPSKIIWYKMGYQCKLKQEDVVMVLSIHMPTLQPYFFSEVL